MGVHEQNSKDHQDIKVWKWQVESLIGSVEESIDAPDCVDVPLPVLETKDEEITVSDDSQILDEDTSINDDSSCLVDVNKYLTGVVADEDTIVVPVPELNFDDELLKDPESLTSVDKPQPSKTINEESSLDRLEDVEIDDEVEQKDFEVEFARELRSMEPNAPAETIIRYRVPVSSVVAMLILSVALTAVLALLIVELYNVALPSFVVTILEKVKG